MSKLSRVVKFIFAIWILAFSLAAPQAFQFGLVLYKDGGVSCTVSLNYYKHDFTIINKYMLVKTTPATTALTDKQTNKQTSNKDNILKSR